MNPIIKSTAQFHPLHSPAVLSSQSPSQQLGRHSASWLRLASFSLLSCNHARWAHSYRPQDGEHLSTNEHLAIRSAHQRSTSETFHDESKAEVIPPLMYHDSNFLDVTFLDQAKESDENSFALVMLNYHMPLLTVLLWNKACLRVCADGGANQIYDSVPHLLPHDDPTEVRKRYKPEVIIGDLDSVRPEVKEFYAGLGTKILENSDDQDTTDFQKSVFYVKDVIASTKTSNVKLVVLGAFGGRLDHTFANINVLFMFPEVRIVLLSDESMAFLLPKNFNHEVLINSSIEGPQCGLLPVGGSSISTTTTGLKWNLDKTSMQFGGLISTSNIQINDVVTVHSDADLVWTISLQKLNDQIKQYMASCKINKIP